MKVVIDTNVLVSGIFFAGKPLEILRAWHKKRFELIISHEILDEYVKTVEDLHRKYPNVNSAGTIKAIAVNAEMVFATPLPTPVCEDPDDDMFLAAALAGKSKLVISGDKLLQNTSGWQGISVISPAAFTKKFLGSE